MEDNGRNVIDEGANGAGQEQDEKAGFAAMIAESEKFVNKRTSRAFLVAVSIVVLAIVIVSIVGLSPPVKNVSGRVYRKAQAYLYEVESQGFFRSTGDALTNMFTLEEDGTLQSNEQALNDFLKPYIDKCDQAITSSSTQDEIMLMEKVKDIYTSSALAYMMQTVIIASETLEPSILNNPEIVHFKEYVEEWRESLKESIDVMKSWDMDAIRELDIYNKVQ